MFFYIIAIASAMITAAVCLFGFTGSLLRAALIFAVCLISIFLIWAASCIICTAFVNKNKPCIKHNPIFRFYANCIISALMQLLRVKLHITGIEKLPKEKFLMVGNHKSSMDPILEMGVLRKHNIGFVAKKELFNIPVIGKIMHKCFCLSLDRKNPRDDVKTILQAINIINSGEASIGIYPEGTRNPGKGLLPFKAGAFKIAQKAQCPIVVAVIKNSDLIMKNAPFKKTDIYIDMIEVLDADYIWHSTTAQISKKVYELIRNHL